MTTGLPPPSPSVSEPHPAPSIERADVAAYIASHCQVLQEIARQSRLDFLAYLVDMARLEAVEQARRPPLRTVQRTRER